MPKRATGRFFSTLVVLLLGVVMLFFIWRSPDKRARHARPATHSAVAPVALDAGTRLRALPREPAPPVQPPQGGPCLPEAAELCHQGDVWLVDSCGRPEEKLEECEGRLCHEDACDEPASSRCSEPTEGRCDGELVRACIAGQPVTVDCAAQGLRCVMGEEGAECAPPVPAGERCRDAPPRCEGDTLLSCDQGRKVRLDCQPLRSKCLQLPGAKAPACVALQPLVLTSPECGPCGCVVRSDAGESRCDGRDDDGDNLVDEQLSCGAVPLVAFIVTGAGGQTSHAREDVEAELAALNRAFARELPEQGLSFELADLFFLADERLLDIDPKELSQLADDARLHPPRSSFYVPVVFTDTLSAGGSAPRIGVSTLPNGTCGGVQEGQGPDVGLVAVAKGRSPTTLIHELGHFLGLCHTHDRQQAPLLAARDATGALVACNDSCRGDGDGVCDTPFDPGPEQCAFDVSCQTACRSSAMPDTANLMSYYTPCRRHFSDQQMQLMQHTLALRRGWHGCLSSSCACSPGGDGCPVGMSCLPVALAGGERANRCLLAGPLRPGSDCQEAGQCGAGALCLTDGKRGVQRCARACLTSRPGCDCTPANEQLSVCNQDLTM